MEPCTLNSDLLSAIWVCLRFEQSFDNISVSFLCGQHQRGEPLLQTIHTHTHTHTQYTSSQSGVGNLYWSTSEDEGSWRKREIEGESFYLYAPLRRHLEVGLPYTWPWNFFSWGGGGGGVACSYIQLNSTCFNQNTMILCLFSLWTRVT